MYVEGDGYHAWNDMSVEVETADFLYGLVRLVRPDCVVESGSGQAYASLKIAEALRDNERGHLLSFDADPYWAGIAREKLHELPASVYIGDTLGWSGDADIVFLDSGPDHRPAEIAYWLERPGPILVIHDAYRYELPGGVMFKTPRGLWLRT